VNADGDVLTPEAGALSYSITRLRVTGGTGTARTGTTPRRAIPGASQPGLFATTRMVGNQSGTGFHAVARGLSTPPGVPTYAWQTANPYDADADGFPDVPPAALDLSRPLPDAVASADHLIASAARALRHHAAYGAITDQRLESGVPAGTRLLVIADMRVWT